MTTAIALVRMLFDDDLKKENKPKQKKNKNNKTNKNKYMELEKFKYDNKIVKMFAYATILWGLVGMLVGYWSPCN